MKRLRTILLIAAVLLALPYWGIWIVAFPLQGLYQLKPGFWLIEWLTGAVFLPSFFGTLALADQTRYVVISLAALVAGIGAVVTLIAHHRGRVWRRPAFYLGLAALAGVIAFPFLYGTYQPAVKTAAGVELRQVDRPGGLARIVKGLQASAEVRPLVYEPLGWADAQTLVYRVWRGAGYDRTGGWRTGISGPIMAYDLAADHSRPWDGALDSLYREPCPNGACVRPLLTEYYQPTDRNYFPGHYDAVLPSPDGGWFALVAWHIYGPEDLVVLGATK